MSSSVDLPAAQRQYYDQLFKVADADNDGYIGVADSGFFRKSNLPNTILGEVWQLSDSRKEGRLDREDFMVALSLISLAQQGKRLGLDVLRGNVIPPPKLADIPPMSISITTPQVKQDEWIISPQERKQYLDMFRANDDDGDGFITGVQARNLFSSSGLPLATLGQIWLMADMNKDQKLDPHEFVIAKFLIANKKKGIELPPVVPESLIASVWPDPSSPTHATLPPSLPTTNIPKGNEWVIPPSEKVKYDDLFKKTDTDHDGFISGEQARNLFLRSKVAVADLSRIWALSDITQDQRLDKQEFAIAMFLIHCRISGREIPTPIPEALINSSRDDFVPTSSTIVPLPPKSSRYDNLDEMFGPTASPISSAPTLPTTSIPSVAISTPVISSLPTDPTQHTHSLPDRRFASNPMQHGSGALAQSGSGPVQFLSGSNALGLLSPTVGLSPAVGSTSGMLQPGSSFGSLSPAFGGVPLVPSAALEVERTRQANAHHEKTKSDMTEQLRETNNAATEAHRLLEEELARKDALVAEITELETQIGAQRARGNMYKDNITAIRLEVKNMSTQKEQLEDLLKEKRLQCEDQEQILADLRIELNEKTSETDKYKTEIDQLKLRLENLRKETADVKTQLVTAKKHISDHKSEISRLTDETKTLKMASVSSSPPVSNRAASPLTMSSYPNTPNVPTLHPPVTRASSLSSTIVYQQDTGAPIPHSSSLTSSPVPTSFNFPPAPTDTFSFDNGREDPFSFNSKDGFGLSTVTADSFGSQASSQTNASPSHHNQDQPFNDNSFFGTSDTFGDSKDPFATGASEVAVGTTSNDPFATSYAFGGAVAPKDTFESFGSSGSVTQESFGSGPGSVAQSFVPPTPHNTVVGDRKGGLSGADIASAFSSAAFGGENGSETTSSFFGSTEDTFGTSAFASTTNDSFGTKDAFGNNNDGFSSAGTDSLKTNGGFNEATFSHGSGGFHGDSVMFAAHRGAFAAVEGDAKRGSGAYPGVEADVYGKRDSAIHKAGSEVPTHPFGPDAFGNSDAFGTSDAFGAPNAFGTSGDAFTTSAFGSSDAFGSNGNDVFGKSDAFGSTSSAFGDASHPTTNLNSSGNVNGAAEDNRFGDVFGKTDGFGSFNFTDKKADGYDF